VSPGWWRSCAAAAASAGVLAQVKQNEAAKLSHLGHSTELACWAGLRRERQKTAAADACLVLWPAARTLFRDQGRLLKSQSHLKDGLCWLCSCCGAAQQQPHTNQQQDMHRLQFLHVFLDLIGNNGIGCCKRESKSVRERVLQISDQVFCPLNCGG
jgi:hypothetical protein